ncbi:MAG: AMP-binding protein [Rhodanobacter sp.]
MSSVPYLPAVGAASTLPLLAGELDRILAWRDGCAVTAAQFLTHVQVVADSLPAAAAVVNLCNDRYVFMVAFCAAAVREQITLLPSSRAPQAVEDVMRAHPGCYALGEQALDCAPSGYRRMPPLQAMPAAAPGAVPQIAAEQVVAIGYTSGSTGVPNASAKTWRSLYASNAGNLAMLQAQVPGAFAILATVPPQHMYGLETSVLLPLLGSHSVHAGRPFFPADVAQTLAQLPVPRVLVSTPVHLRALVESGVALPPLAAMLSATAPLPLALARAAEQRFNAPLREVFGSTETCVFASRRPTVSEDWQLFTGVTLQPQPDGTLVHAPQLDSGVTLADLVTVAADGSTFQLCGRRADLLEIAGKRASLGDLTRRLLAIPGVSDGVVFQLEACDGLGVQRIAAVAVAPGLDESTIIEALRCAIDPVFLPRPLRLLATLPRNETGKLPRAALLALIAGEPATGGGE